jgi:hypothetical protein
MPEAYFQEKIIFTFCAGGLISRKIIFIFYAGGLISRKNNFGFPHGPRSHYISPTKNESLS